MKRYDLKGRIVAIKAQLAVWGGRPPKPCAQKARNSRRWTWTKAL